MIPFCWMQCNKVTFIPCIFKLRQVSIPYQRAIMYPRCIKLYFQFCASQQLLSPNTCNLEQKIVNEAIILLALENRKCLILNWWPNSYSWERLTSTVYCLFCNWSTWCWYCSTVICLVTFVYPRKNFQV